MALKSVQMILGVIGAGGQSYTCPTGKKVTIRACMFHNTSASVATVTATANSVQVLEALPIEVSGNQPTIAYGLLGQTLTAGQSLALTAGTNDVITAYVSGVEEVA